MSGAAQLATHAAQRLCGMVTISCPDDTIMAYALACPAAVLQSFVKLAELLEIADRRKCTAVIIGCGAGVSEATRKATLTCLQLPMPVVLDADALTSFADTSDLLFKAVQEREEPVVMTPHAGEFIRLFGRIKDDRVRTVQDAARESGAVVVLKGHETIIASPQGEVVINNHAPSMLATAGTGDVLAGMIIALMAGGMPALQAASAGVWIHSEAANQLGLGLVAEDIVTAIPSVLKKIAEA